MSGAGKRFARAGYEKIKPLITVDGTAIIRHVANLFPGEREFIFICDKDHLAQIPDLEKTLRTISANAHIIGIETHAKGPVYAIDQAGAHLPDNEPVIVSYCDFSMDWDYEAFKKTVAQHPEIQSWCVCYKGFHPHLLKDNLYAGTKTDADGNVIEVREKHSFTPDKMDTWQQTGAFYFATGTLLRDFCRLVIEKNITCNNEHYVSLLYNPMIENGIRVKVYPVSHFCQWGTPEDLEEYEAWARLYAREHSIKKEKTDIPPEREAMVVIPHLVTSSAYEKSWQYWKNYFEHREIV